MRIDKCIANISHEVIYLAHVLVVDDEPTIARVLQEVLMEAGLDVDTAPNGAGALRRLEKQPTPDVMLVDLFMPDIGGRAVVQQIRGNPALHELPVILITGAVHREEDFPPPGTYQDIITKPFDVDDVVKRVRRLLHS